MFITVRNFKAILIWLISFQLIHLPIFAQTTVTGSGSGSGSGVSSTTDIKTLSIEECKEDPARNWDSRVNRCVYTTEAVDDRDGYRECQAIEEATERKACFDNYAESKTGVSGNSEIKDDSKGLTIAGMNAALGMLNLFTKGKGSSSCTSKTIHMAAAGAGVLTELYFKFMAKKEFKDLTKRYAEETINSDPFAAQKRAFDFLEEQQLKIADYAKKRKTGYTLLALGYLAAAGFAAYEMLSPSKQSCAGGKDKGSDTDSNADSANSDTASTDTDVSADASADATPAETPPNSPDTATVKSGLTATLGKGFGNLGHPAVILAVSTLSAFFTYKLRAAAQEQEEEAKSNAAHVKAIKERFAMALGDFCPSGGEDMSNPRCFCYTMQGEKNPDRTNSNICQQLWAQDEKNLFAEASNYGRGTITKVGCFRVDNKFDQQCQCKKFIDDSGQNACLKTLGTSSNMPPSLQSAFSLPVLSSSLDSVNSGTSAGNLSGTSFGSALATAKKARDQLVDKLNAKRVAMGEDPFPSGDQLANKFLSSPAHVASYNALGSRLPDLANALPSNPAIAKVISKVKTDTGINKDLKKATLLSSRAKKKKGYKFQFEEDGNKVVNLGKQVSAQDQYEYGQNDINSDPDTNIFEIITRRYNLSGLERLFNE